MRVTGCVDQGCLVCSATFTDAVGEEHLVVHAVVLRGARRVWAATENTEEKTRETEALFGRKCKWRARIAQFRPEARIVTGSSHTVRPDPLTFNQHSMASDDALSDVIPESNDISRAVRKQRPRRASPPTPD